MDQQSPLMQLVNTFRTVAFAPVRFFDSLGRREEWFPAFDYAILAASFLALLLTLFWSMGHFFLSPKAPLLSLVYFAFNMLMVLLVMKLLSGLINRVCRFFSGIDDPKFAYEATAYAFGIFAFWPITFGVAAVYAYVVYVIAIMRHYDLSVIEAVVAWLIAFILLGVCLFFMVFPLWVVFAGVMTMLGIVPG